MTAEIWFTQSGTPPHSGAQLKVFDQSESDAFCQERTGGEPLIGVPSQSIWNPDVFPHQLLTRIRNVSPPVTGYAGWNGGPTAPIQSEVVPDPPLKDTPVGPYVSVQLPLNQGK